MTRAVPFMLGGASALVVIGIGGLAVVETGAFDVRASSPHSPIVAWATHTTMIHAAQRAADSVHPPPNFTPAEVLAGFSIYDEDCVTCHGAPGIARAHWTDGLTPSPPYLVDAPRHWSSSELYWIVANGVKMTAMPAWNVTRSRGKIWDVIAFLEAQPYLSQHDYAALRRERPPPVAAPSPQTTPSPPVTP